MSSNRLADIAVGVLIVLALIGLYFLLRPASPTVQSADIPQSPKSTIESQEVTIPNAPGTGTEPQPVPSQSLPSANADSVTSSSPSTSSASPYTENTQQENSQNQSGEIPQTGAMPRAGGAVTTSENRMPTRSDYRISLGGFSNPDSLLAQTSEVSKLGYKVYSIDLGGGRYVAQIGPFDNSNDANKALEDIQRVYAEAQLFRPKASVQQQNTPSATTSTQQRTPSQSASSQTNSQNRPKPTENKPTEPTPKPPVAESTPAPKPTESKPTEPAPKPPVAEKPAPKPKPAEAQVYLQVGAFEDFEKAEQLVTDLQNKGFSPSVNAPDGQMAKVLVGPYSASEVGSAESNLDANGYSHFRLQ